MFNMIIVLGIVILIVILSCYLIHDSEFVKKISGGARDNLSKVKKAGSFRHDLRIANGPIVQVKCPGEVSYSTFELTKDVVKIGRSSRNDIVLDDAAVENTHARIEKRMKGNSVFYEFINLSKRNPAEILNQETSDYEYLGYRKGIVLGDSEVFYVGNTKFIFKKPLNHHKLSKTDRLVIDGKDSDNSDQKETKGTVAIRRADKTRPFIKNTEVVPK